MAKSEADLIHKCTFRSSLQEALWLTCAGSYPVWGFLLPLLCVDLNFLNHLGSMPDLTRPFPHPFILGPYILLVGTALYLKHRSVSFRLPGQNIQDPFVRAVPVIEMITARGELTNGRGRLVFSLADKKKTYERSFDPTDLNTGDLEKLIHFLSGPDGQKLAHSTTRSRLNALLASRRPAETIAYAPDNIKQTMHLAATLTMPVVKKWWEVVSYVVTVTVAPMPLVWLSIFSHSYEGQSLLSNLGIFLGFVSILLALILSAVFDICAAYVIVLWHLCAAVVLGIGVPAQFAASQAFAVSNNQIVQLAAAAVLLYIAYRTCKLLAGPTAISIDKEKLTIGEDSWFSTPDSIDWGDLAAIKTEQPPGTTDPNRLKLIMLGNSGKKLAIELGGLFDWSNKEALLRAFEKYAADVPRDPAVNACLRPPQDQTYTELWLAALTQAPQRQKLLPLEAGALLKQGEYTIEEIIGSGGQGLVYAAHHLQLGSAGVAEQSAAQDHSTHYSGGSLVIKESVLPLYVNDEARRSAVERFDRDARLLSQLDSPHMAKVVDYFIEDHRSYLVTERIQGLDLRSRVDADGPLDIAEIMALLGQMIDCLSYIHGRTPPVVHHDFTPDNLIVDKNGRLVLIDFEVAREQSTKTVATTVGKQSYVPPEQLRGKATPASDIYAMGATLFYLATGRDPEPLAMSSLSKGDNIRQADSQEMGRFKILNQIIEGATNLDQARRLSIEDIAALATGKTPQLTIGSSQSADIESANTQSANTESADIESAVIESSDIESSDIESSDIESAAVISVKIRQKEEV